MITEGARLTIAVIDGAVGPWAISRKRVQERWCWSSDSKSPHFIFGDPDVSGSVLPDIRLEAVEQPSETMSEPARPEHRRIGSEPSQSWRIAEVFTFETCTYKCAYCLFVEYGKVLDSSQLKPYRDPEFIRRVANFFNSRVTEDCHWLVQFTGGEPLLMPNFALLCDLLGDFGNKIALYTALMIGREHLPFVISWKERRRLPIISWCRFIRTRKPSRLNFSTS